jgi:hypothetical protein
MVWDFFRRKLLRHGFQVGPRALVLGSLLGSLAGGAMPAFSQGGVASPLPEGVTVEIDRAIERGIQYLLAQENGDGSWDIAPTPGRQGVYACATTGLVGLVFLAHGDTPTRGTHAALIRRITDFLLEGSQPDGLITRPNDYRSMYGHAFAMTFLAQIFGQEPDAARREQIRDVLHRAIQLTARSQSDDGGWAYTPNSSEDEGTLTVTQLQALRSCRDAGIVVSKNMIDKGVKYLESSQNPDGSVRYRAAFSGRNAGEVRPGVSCAAIVAWWNAGYYTSGQNVSDKLKATVDYVNRNVYFTWNGMEHAEYVCYYLSQAKWVLGGKEWPKFYKMASQQLLQTQERDGHWQRGADAQRYGSTFGTAVALIILQLPYNRLPVYQR